MNTIERELTESCETATVELNGFRCTNHKIIESKIIQIDGYDAYQVTGSRTETYQDQSTSEIIGISIYIPIGDNTWKIGTKSWADDYEPVKPQLRKSIESFKFTNDGLEPELEYSELGNLNGVMPFFQPITSRYVNSDVGLEIDFPENWQGIQMQFPKELFEGIAADELSKQFPDESHEQLLNFLTGSTIVMVFPEDNMMMMPEQGTLDMNMIFIVETSAFENLMEIISQSMTMSESPDSLFEGITEKSESEDCDINSSKIIIVNNMKAYKIEEECTISETNQSTKSLVYMFGTNDYLIMIMQIDMSKQGQSVNFSEFSKSLDTLKIGNPVDFSDPYTYSELFGMSVETKKIRSDTKTHEFTIVSNTLITDFAYYEQSNTIEFVPVAQKEVSVLGYTDIHHDNLLEGPFTAFIDGKESNDILLVTEDTTTDKTILGLEYILPANKITVVGKEISKDTDKSIPDWIRNNAKWWSEGNIGDSDFVSGIQFMIKERIIDIPDLPEQASEAAQEKVPDWIKTNAGWWADGLISDNDFIKGIQFLVEQGIIKI